MSNQVENGEKLVKYLLTLVKDARPSTRLLSSTCLTNLNKVGVLSDQDNSISLVVLPTLVKLLNEKNPVKSRAPLVLAYLVSDNESLQKAACDADAISKLAAIITGANGNGPAGDQLKEVN
jgi:hypothetical protein